MTAAAPALDERPAATLPLPNGFAHVVSATAAGPPPAGIPLRAGVDALAPADPLVRGSLL